MNRIIYPGSFDPITNGHVDIIKRLSKIFDEIIVVVAHSSDKKSFFTAKERLAQIRDVFKNDKKITVEIWDGLLVDFCEKKKCFLLCKGLRSVKDFEYEIDMAQTNKKLNPKIETFFLSTDPELRFISSSLVREVISMGGDISPFVPRSINAIKKNSKD